MNKDEVNEALQELIADGLVIDSGERRPDSKGVMQIVWKLNPDHPYNQRQPHENN